MAINVSDAKRGRYLDLKQEAEELEDYELEIHQNGPHEFELEECNENMLNEEDVTNCNEGEVPHRAEEDSDDVLKAKPILSRFVRKQPLAVGDAQMAGIDDEARAKLKRPYTGQAPPVPNYERETDPAVIARRTKQIEYGKGTPEYYNYCTAVPRDTRQPNHPKTPNKYRKYSRRAWDGMVKQWRINLHCWSDYQISTKDQIAASEADLEKLNESFASEASGSTSTTSSIAAAFSAELGFLNSTTCSNSDKSRNACESENEISISGSETLNSTVLDKLTRKDMIKEEVKNEKMSLIMSTSWADETDEFYASDDNETP